MELHGAKALQNGRYWQLQSSIGFEYDILPGSQHAAFQHPAVQSRLARPTETQCEIGIADANRQGGAGNAGGGHFQLNVICREPVANVEFCAVDTIKNEVLTKKPGFDRKAQRAGPEVEIGGAHDVNRLIRPAVMFAIADGVTTMPSASTMTGPCTACLKMPVFVVFPGSLFASPRHTALIFMNNPLRFMIPVSRFMQ